MPALEVSDLTQRCVYMPYTGNDSYGQPTVGPPQEIRCRWVWKKREVVDAKGNTIAIDADVAVSIPIHVGARMWLGLLEDWLGTGSAPSVTDQNLCEVKLAPDTPDVKGRNHRYTVSLMRFHDKQGSSD